MPTVVITAAVIAATAIMTAIAPTRAMAMPLPARCNPVNRWPIDHPREWHMWRIQPRRCWGINHRAGHAHLAINRRMANMR